MSPLIFMFYFDFLSKDDSLCKKLEKLNHKLNYTISSLIENVLTRTNTIQNDVIYLQAPNNHIPYCTITSSSIHSKLRGHFLYRTPNKE